MRLMMALYVFALSAAFAAEVLAYFRRGWDEDCGRD